MKKCKSCQKEIDKKAKKCPHCQTDQRNWFARHPIITIILVLIVIGMIGSSGNKGNVNTQSTTKNNTVANEKPTEQPKPIVVEALELIKEYDSNKLSAQDKYTGKIVQTTAYITNISNDIGGSYYLSLKPNQDEYYFGTSIKCIFKDKSVLTPLTKGQEVTFVGTMENMSLGIVVMKDCELK